MSRFEPGRALLQYRLLEKIGEGGMGEVWRAVDTALDREVAIKLLPAAFVADPERLARFEREAKVLASLSHPHVAAIHGLHMDAGERFLAMELVPGEDLAQRLARGPLAVEEAIAVARQIAEALEYAHDRGIVHRDLKPANVKITPDGEVKVLDYGLAKAMVDDPSHSGPTTTPTMMPTITGMGTTVGTILGTAAYMSPEQARGRAVDKRADIWAFGCVLWEMLVGRRAFDGETVTDVLAAVVTRDPDRKALPSGTPASVRRLLARCLDKDARTRLRDAGEARIALTAGRAQEEEVDPRGSAPGRAVSRRGAMATLAWAALALVGGIALERLVLAPRVVPPRELEFDVTLPGRRIEMGSIALSPDGSTLAFVARDENGVGQLHVRGMDSVDSRVLPGTSGALYPFWSRDGREVAFFSEHRLLRVAMDGAAARPVAVVPDPLGGSWGTGDVILVGSLAGPIRKVVAGGSEPVSITVVEEGVEDTHAWPAFLPDGKRFVFLADASTDEGHRVRLGQVDSGPTTILKRVVRSQPVVDPAGRLLLSEAGQLVAYPFDFRSGTLGSQSALVASKVHALATRHHAPFSAAAGGALALQSGSSETALVLLDFEGRVIRRFTDAERIGNPAISPDGRRASFEVFTDTKERLIWVLDLERGVRTAISQRGSLADSSTWGADGETVLFDANPGGTWEAFRKAVDGGGEPEPLRSNAPSDIGVLDASADGRWLLTAMLKAESRYDLVLRDLAAAEGGWIAWSSGPFDENFGTFSPDSRWIAYTSDASGRTEVYVAPLEGGPSVRRFQISSGGGDEPHFSHDGKRIFYRSARDEWMSVDVELRGDRVEAKMPATLFPMPGVDLPWVRNSVDVMPDGSGLLAVQSAGSRETSIRVRTGGR